MARRDLRGGELPGEVVVDRPGLRAGRAGLGHHLAELGEHRAELAEVESARPRALSGPRPLGVVVAGRGEAERQIGHASTVLNIVDPPVGRTADPLDHGDRDRSALIAERTAGQCRPSGGAARAGRRGARTAGIRRRRQGRTADRLVSEAMSWYSRAEPARAHGAGRVDASPPCCSSIGAAVPIPYVARRARRHLRHARLRRRRRGRSASSGEDIPAVGRRGRPGRRAPQHDDDLGHRRRSRCSARSACGRPGGTRWRPREEYFPPDKTVEEVQRAGRAGVPGLAVVRRDRRAALPRLPEGGLRRRDPGRLAQRRRAGAAGPDRRRRRHARSPTSPRCRPRWRQPRRVRSVAVTVLREGAANRRARR